jgi:hypothetical protein
MEVLANRDASRRWDAGGRVVLEAEGVVVRKPEAVGAPKAETHRSGLEKHAWRRMP